MNVGDVVLVTENIIGTYPTVITYKGSRVMRAKNSGYRFSPKTGKRITCGDRWPTWDGAKVAPAGGKLEKLYTLREQLRQQLAQVQQEIASELGK
jgi:hypothetical protein